MADSARTAFGHSREYFPLDRPVMRYLVLWDMKDKHSDVKLGQVLLKLKPSIDGYQNIEVPLRQHE